MLRWVTKVTGRGTGWKLIQDKAFIGYSRKNKIELN